ncbi:hypothetical protein INR49_018885 [Caranx melampygus]|nr:hypothetical protein INR49_018885 [Caranx melampygus]
MPVQQTFTTNKSSYTRAPPQAANPVIHLQDSFQSAYSSPVAQEPSHQKAHTEKWNEASSISVAVQDPAALASFSMDMELERRSQRGNLELTNQLSVTQRASITYAEGHPSVSATGNESPQYYSFDSTQMDGEEYNNRSMDQVLYCPLGPDQNSSTLEEFQDYMVCGNGSAVDNNEGTLSLEDQSSIFHSIMEEDEDILVCLASEGQKTHNNVVHTALTDTRETTSPVQAHVKISTSEKSTSTVPCVPTCDIMVATEATPSVSAFTQSESPETADKNIITEVHMADLDYFAGEFIRIMTAQQNLREQKEKMKSSGSKLRKECDCVQRAQRAELSLLTLQYSMCRQHCWRLYYTTAEGLQLTATHADMNQYRPKEPPANIVRVLQKLESDYNQMRDKILAGVPLEHLKPLTVDSEQVPAGAGYTPAQIVGDMLENLPSWSLKPQECEEHGGPRDQDSSGGQDGEKRDERAKKENRKQRRAATPVPQVKGAASKEPNMSEAWYDAEEDLEPGEGQDPRVITHDQTSDCAGDEAQSSVLCVSNLPSNVTESDVMLWFDKYCPSEVCVSVSKTGVRVAIVMVNGAQSAEAAVKGLNGFSVEGHTLHVEHITGAASRGRSQTSASVSESSQERTKPQPPRADRSSAERKVTSLSSSARQGKVVCISPTTTGTCVPQHFGTMDSFDTLMSELTQLHPDVGRQRIIDALVELRSRHQGVLSGLPLSTIREMTSVLLSRPANATQL